MLVLKRNHYIAALVILVLVVLLAVWRSGHSGEVRKTQEVSESVAVQTASPESEAAETAAEPVQERETLVGVWIPYMSLSTAEKTEDAFKANYDAKIESAKAMGVNAVFVHVRPFADSFYPSEYEPWSHILTGTQGKDPGYDPLAYMVE